MPERMVGNHIAKDREEYQAAVNDTDFCRHGHLIVVYAPPYSEKCGGCQDLHLLVDLINTLCWKQEPAAYIYPFIGREKSFAHHPGYKTPILPTWISPQDHIVLYPEIVHGNPLNSTNIIRWIMYFPGIHGGPKSFDSTDLIACYSWNFCQSLKGQLHDLVYLRLVDYQFEFFKNIEHLKSNRSGILYLKKKDTVMIEGITITRNHTEQELIGKPLIPGIGKRARIEQLAQAEYFYSYDPYSFIFVEAAMTGCVAVVVPFDNMTRSDWMMGDELEETRYGVAFGLEEVQNATKSLPLVLSHLRNLSGTYQDHVKRFLTNVWAKFEVHSGPRLQ